MDTLTHAIIGATVAQTTHRYNSRESQLPVKNRLWLGGLAATFPDIDYIGSVLNPLSFISDWHRSLTHSFIMLPLWALLLGLIYAFICNNKDQWREATLISAVAIFSHILSDTITSWGTQIFAPLSTSRITLGTTFVIDPYFTLIVLSGLLISIYRRSRFIATLALLGLVVYVGFQALLKSQVYDIAESRIVENQWPATSIYVMPQPLSPFNWKIIITETEEYHMTYLNLLASVKKLLPEHTSNSLLNILDHYRSPSQLLWAHYTRYGDATDRAVAWSAWHQPEFERYRRFAQFPAVTRVILDQGESCVEFMDLRFTLPEMKTPFRYTLCQNTADNSSRVIQLN